MSYITVIGLEIHAELLTKTKLFCSCENAFGGNPNSRVCPVCTGFPGTLPTLNTEAVNLAVKAGICLNSEINEISCFDRKNYFYPDLPKAYQISQLYRPICVGGNVGKIRINNIHLEEDAGKLIHSGDISQIDLNRSGVPLIEIVTEPDFRSADEVIEFLTDISGRFKYANICDSKMEQGSIRVDLNISLMKETDCKLGTRAEIKNINSFRSLRRAIAFEEKRQQEILDNGLKVEQETRRFDENTGKTISMRKKEEANDYRYFPEPDIPPVLITKDEIEALKSSIPTLPHMRKEHYTKDFKIPEAEANLLVEEKAFSDFFEEACLYCKNFREISKLMLGELSFLLNSSDKSILDVPFTPKQFSELVELFSDGTINRNILKEILKTMFYDGGNPKEIAMSFKNTISEEDILEKLNDIIKDNKKLVDEYFNGSDKVVNFLMGHLMRTFGKSIDPNECKTLIINTLNGLKG